MSPDESTTPSPPPPPPPPTTTSPFQRTSLLSLPPESIRYIADLLVTEELPECLFERDHAFRTASYYVGQRQPVRLLSDGDEAAAAAAGSRRRDYERLGGSGTTRSSPGPRAFGEPGPSSSSSSSKIGVGRGVGGGYNIEDGDDMDLFTVNRFTKDGYTRDGYTRDGFTRDGYTRDGYTRDGFTRDGFTRDGYTRDGYTRDGFTRDGFTRDGYTRDGYTRDGFTRDGYTRDGYSRDGYSRDGYTRDSRMKSSRNVRGVSTTDDHDDNSQTGDLKDGGRGMQVDRAGGSTSAPALSNTPKQYARPVKDDDLIMRGVRNLSAVCRNLRAKLRPVLLSRIRIVSQEMMDWALSGGKDDVALFRDVRLVPTTHILSATSQLALLRLIVPGQLRALAISLQPYLLADNVTFGYHPAQDPMGEIVRRIAQLGISGLQLRTNMLGLSRSLPLIRNLRELSIEDVGVWDGGDSSTYQQLISPQHRILSEILHNSSATLERIIFRRKVNPRAKDYGHVNYGAVLFQDGLHFPRLRELQLRRCNVSVPSLKRMLDDHSELQTLMFYPEHSMELPTLPNSIRQLFTNSHLSATPIAVPKDMQALCVTANGPLLPAPEQDFVPPLPNTLSTLHARLLPGVSEHQIRRLLENMKNLVDIELVVKPLPWAECQCEPVSDALGDSLSYELAWETHQRAATAIQVGWQDGVSIRVIASILSIHKGLHTFTFNHDKHLILRPFPNIQHHGRTATNKLIPQWWATNEASYEIDVRFLFQHLPPLRVVRWKVCESQREAWAIWERESDGLMNAMLLVEQEK